MNKKLFRELVESMTQMNEIVRGKRAPSRKFQVDAIAIKELRAKIGLSQTKFAALLNVASALFPVAQCSDVDVQQSGEHCATGNRADANLRAQRRS